MSLLRRLILHIIATGSALYFVGVILEGDFLITGGIKGYLIGAIAFGFLNSILKPILKLLSLPLMVITVGFFSFIINTFLVWFAEYALDVLQFEGVTVLVEGGFFTYLMAGFLISLFNMVISWLLKK